MILTRLIVLIICVMSFTLVSSESERKTKSLFPDELDEDMKRITKEITGDPDALEKLSAQLRELTGRSEKPMKIAEPVVSSEQSNQTENRMAPESSQPGGNPLVAMQSRINAMFESMNSFVRNFRQLLGIVPNPVDHGEASKNATDPVKQAIQALEEFQKVLNQLKIPSRINGTSTF